MTAAIRKRIIEQIERWTEEQLDFLIDLCSQNSYTFYKAGTDRLAPLILEKLEDALPVHEEVKQESVGDHHILRNDVPGSPVYLLGHLDTVFPPDHPFQSCHIKNEWLYGPGTADMKGGLAVLVYALKALQKAGVLASLPVVLILGADEENGSATSRNLYETERDRARICLVGECAGPAGEIVVSRNGKMGGRVDCTGRGRHVGTGSHEKASAILEIAHKVIKFESLNASLPGVSLNVGKIEGGLGPSTVPAQAGFLFDLRWQDQAHYPILLEQIHKIVSRRENAHCESVLTILNFRPAMPKGKKTGDLMDRLRRIGKGLGQEIKMEHRRGTSDGNYFGAAGVPTLDGFGPVGESDHTPEERILISSLKDRTLLLALFLLDLAGGKG
ncbi:MAG: M20/M25/M40 family metallo-hydrolase [Acidobacteriota bacterium]